MSAYCEFALAPAARRTHVHAFMPQDFLLDLLLVAACACAATLTALAFRMQGAAAAGVAAAALAVLGVQINGDGLAQIGLAGPPNIEILVPFVLAGLAASYAVAGSTSYVLSRLGIAPDVTRLDFVKGNLPALLLMLGVSWTTAAFGEEIVFRGFLLNRLAGESVAVANWPWIVLVLQAFVFGLAHVYQGIGGVVVTGALGTVLGGLTMAAGGDLWPAILVHGLINTVSLIAIYVQRPSY
jgi:hypothetical protein